jgi:hypothetical protein
MCHKLLKNALLVQGQFIGVGLRAVAVVSRSAPLCWRSSGQGISSACETQDAENALAARPAAISALRSQTEHPGKRGASALFPTLLRLSVCVSSVENIDGVIPILRAAARPGLESKGQARSRPVTRRRALMLCVGALPRIGALSRLPVWSLPPMRGSADRWLQSAWPASPAGPPGVAPPGCRSGSQQAVSGRAAFARANEWTRSPGNRRAAREGIARLSRQISTRHPVRHRRPASRCHCRGHQPRNASTLTSSFANSVRHSSQSRPPPGSGQL